ncbi:MAG TPA: hypothetical protein VET88_01920, partial [Gammaproteobacteria bacterium]|nr:hypothetical protein [Gammaproteobacteria bacterium]
MSMRLHPQLNLLSGLIITIILLGGISAATVYVNARTYRDLAFDFQRQYMTQMIAAESANILAEEDRNARSIGLRVQRREDFRQAVERGDGAAISAVLDAQSRLEPDVPGQTDIRALYVFGPDARLLGRSGEAATADAALVCPGLVTKARVRTGTLREKPLYELCLYGGLPHLASLLPLDRRTANGYLQVVTDPLPKLLRIGYRLKMPVQISRTDGTVIHTASAWTDRRTDHEVTSEYVLTANNSRPALNIAAQRNADSL